MLMYCDVGRQAGRQRGSPDEIHCVVAVAVLRAVSCKVALEEATYAEVNISKKDRM
jgi:hypothetical protein